ncbi:glycerate-and formate-dehydrogenase, partial [Acaromyces ingoldii]
MPTNTVTKKRVLALGTPRFAVAEFEQLCKSYDVDVVLPHPSDRDDTVKRIHEAAAARAADGGYDAMFWLFGTSAYSPFDEHMLTPVLASGRCGLLASGGAGYNDVAFEWAAERGAYVTNTPDGPTQGTADMALLLFLSALRQARLTEQTMRSGHWRQGLPLMDDPQALTVGIYGMGAIGRAFAKKIAGAFPPRRIIYHNRSRLSPKQELEAGGAEYVSFEELLKTSDVLSIHCPLTEQTEGSIGADQFAIMKDGVYIVNTARGAVLGEAAFIAAIESGKVAAAGLDVFDNEPRPNPFWLTCDRVTVQPHWGGFSKMTIKRGEGYVLANVRAFLEAGTPINPVNKP